MLDTILRIGSAFDWISPLVALGQDLVNGPSHTLLVSYGHGWSGREVIRLLRNHGVRTWGHMVVRDRIMITVRQRQARWAEYLLNREGVPLENPTFDQPGGTRSRPSLGIGPASRSTEEKNVSDILRNLSDMRIF